MTVNELQLPLDFGLEDLYVPSNNNAAFLLANGKRFDASSVILGFHSPVIKERYVKQGILEIEADDFSHETVKTVCEAMYNGLLRITRENFREVNKFVHVFQVSWMSTKCLQFFEATFEEPQDFKYLFGEAVNFSHHGRSAALLEVWKDKTTEEKRCDVLRGYLEPGSDYPDYLLETLIDLTADHSVFLDHIRDRASKTRSNLDNVTKYLLKTIDLVGCFERHTTRSTEIFDQLLEYEDSADWRMLNNLYRKVSKECLIRQSKETTVCSKPAVSDITLQNLFQFHEFTLGGTIKDIIADAVRAGSCNLYMVIEAITSLPSSSGYKLSVSPSLVHDLQAIIREKGWSPVHSNFLDTCASMIFNSGLLRKCVAITAKASSPNCVRAVSEEVTDIMSFMTTSTFKYPFHLELPGSPKCDMKSKCGFLIGVTGMSWAAPEQFNIQLILDNSKYPADLHCHGISPDRIHLVLEGQRNNKWFNMGISWRRKPEYLSNGIMSWDIKRPSESSLIRLVAYYTI